MRFFSFFRNLYDRRYINVLAFGGKQDKIMNVNYDCVFLRDKGRIYFLNELILIKESRIFVFL